MEAGRSPRQKKAAARHRAAMAKALEIPGFDPNASLDECISLLLKARTGDIESFRQGLYEKTVDAVHDMRVSCRRLQTVLMLFEDSIKKNLLKKFNKNLRALIKRLGKARQFDVVMETVSPIMATTSARQLMVANLFMAHFRTKRFKAMQKALKAFREFRADPLYKRFISPAHDVSLMVTAKKSRRDKNPGFPLTMREFISKLLKDFLSGAEGALINADDPAALHAMRIRGKPLRFAMEQAQPFLKKPFGAHYLEIKTMIEELGFIHDNDVACLALRRFDKELYFFNAATTENRLPRTMLINARKNLEIERQNHLEKVRGTLMNWRARHFPETVSDLLAHARWRRKAAQENNLTKAINFE
jgi:CHAD domain-containing protein